MSSPPTCREIFERDFPYFLSIGMSYDQYWHGDVLLAKAYYEADRKRMEREDLNAWLNGLYVYKAMEATIGNIGKKPGEQMNRYPEKPVSAQPKLTQEQREEQEVAAAELWMEQFCLAGQGWGGTT